MTVAELKGFKARLKDVDSLVFVLGQLNIMSDTYTSVGSQVPEWIIEQIADVKYEINSSLKAERDLELKKLKSSLNLLLPKDEKIKQLQERIAYLEGLNK